MICVQRTSSTHDCLYTTDNLAINILSVDQLDVVNVFAGTALNQTGRAIEIITMTMLVYLTFSLTTSAFMNWYNARVALKER